MLLELAHCTSSSIPHFGFVVAVYLLLTLLGSFFLSEVQLLATQQIAIDR
jgi:hypothetical protein